MHHLERHAVTDDPNKQTSYRFHVGKYVVEEKIDSDDDEWVADALESAQGLALSLVVPSVRPEQGPRRRASESELDVVTHPVRLFYEQLPEDDCSDESSSICGGVKSSSNEGGAIRWRSIGGETELEVSAPFRHRFLLSDLKRAELGAWGLSSRHGFSDDDAACCFTLFVAPTVRPGSTASSSSVWGGSSSSSSDDEHDYDGTVAARKRERRWRRRRRRQGGGGGAGLESPRGVRSEDAAGGKGVGGVELIWHAGTPTEARRACRAFQALATPSDTRLVASGRGGGGGGGGGDGRGAGAHGTADAGRWVAPAFNRSEAALVLPSETSSSSSSSPSPSSSSSSALSPFAPAACDQFGGEIASLAEAASSSCSLSFDLVVSARGSPQRLPRPGTGIESPPRRVASGQRQQQQPQQQPQQEWQQQQQQQQRRRRRPSAAADPAAVRRASSIFSPVPRSPPRAGYGGTGAGTGAGGRGRRRGSLGSLVALVGGGAAASAAASAAAEEAAQLEAEAAEARRRAAATVLVGGRGGVLGGGGRSEAGGGANLLAAAGAAAAEGAAARAARAQERRRRGRWQRRKKRRDIADYQLCGLTRSEHRRMAIIFSITLPPLVLWAINYWIIYIFVACSAAAVVVGIVGWLSLEEADQNVRLYDEAGRIIFSGFGTEREIAAAMAQVDADRRQLRESARHRRATLLSAPHPNHRRLRHGEEAVPGGTGGGGRSAVGAGFPAVLGQPTASQVVAPVEAEAVVVVAAADEERALKGLALIDEAVALQVSTR